MEEPKTAYDRAQDTLEARLNSLLRRIEQAELRLARLEGPRTVSLTLDEPAPKENQPRGYPCVSHNWGEREGSFNMYRYCRDCTAVMREGTLPR